MKSTLQKIKTACIFTTIIICAAVFSASAQTFYVSAGYYSLQKLDSIGGVTSLPIDPAFYISGGIKLDTNGNLYATDYIYGGGTRVIKINPKGYATVFASGLSGAAGIAFDAAGNLFTANHGNGSISKITPAGVVSTFVPPSTLASPLNLAFDSSGILYSLNDGDGTITKIDAGGTVISNLVETGTFSYPLGLAFDSSGNLTVSDFNGGTNGVGSISKVDPNGVVTLFSQDPAIIYPSGMVYDAAGNLYVSIYNALLKINLNGSIVTNFASLPYYYYYYSYLHDVAISPTGVDIPAITFLDVKKDDLVPTTPVGAMFDKIGIPARNNSGYTAFKASLLTGSGGVIAANKNAIYSGTPGAGTLRVRSGDFAPDKSGVPTAAIFSDFSDPAFNNNNQIGFRGKLKSGIGGVVSSVNDIGLWSSEGGTLHEVTRKGAVAPNTGGATFFSFKSIALPDSGDIVFLGQLTLGSGSPSVSTVNNVGIWIYDSSGHLRLIARTGDSVPVSIAASKVIKKLFFLQTVAVSQGQSRSFATGGGLAYKADFDDGTSGILHVNHP